MEMFAVSPNNKDIFIKHILPKFGFLDSFSNDVYTRYSLSYLEKYSGIVLYLYDYGFTLWDTDPRLGEMFILERTFNSKESTDGGK